jgi:hypothetical protein
MSDDAVAEYALTHPYFRRRLAEEMERRLALAMLEVLYGGKVPSPERPPHGWIINMDPIP